ncbi:MAG TPA: class I SAM-dependent methyltransferase [Acidobacteriaceae bacterium]|nr:class I SAM-dependent methyltransferase [Acidobacteriaceae bacterium]
MTPGTSQAVATFRDPAGSLRIQGDHVLRTVNPRYAPESLRFLESDLARRWIRQGHLVASEVVSAEEDKPLLLQHPRVFFPSYPWEWTPAQWVAAGELTLEFCGQLLREGWILKDATPLNVLFEGTRPVFVDVLSVERRDPRSPLWLAYGQFARTFLLPLAAHKYLGWPLSATLHRRDGYEPADLRPYFSASARWKGPLRSLVTLPFLFESRRRGAGAPPKLQQQPEIATAVLERNLRRCRKNLHSLEARRRHSRWTEYHLADHYSEAERRQKQEFVERVLQSLRPESVLDIGSNTGQYSRIAAGAGARVVGWDTDVASSGCNWAEAKASGLSILPVVADVARPTPAVGWRNAEYLPLLDRAYQRFDCVLMLGILHHLLLADQIPMADVAALLWSLTRRWSIVEWVPKTDPRYIDLCRGRDELYGHLDEALFLEQFTRHFTLVNREELNNGRVLFLFERR